MRILFSLFFVFSVFASEDPYVIVSIDGGGIRGVIPSVILDMMERDLNIQTAKVVDCLSGSSTGGIIAVGLSVARDKGSNVPRHWAREIVDIYKREGQDIFSRPLLYRVKTLNGLFGPKYDVTKYKLLLSLLLGDTTLNEVVKDVCITSFDVIAHKEFLFENFGTQDLKNCSLVDVVLSTSAAPTYFPSRIYQGKNLIDGGVLANNPAAWAYFEVVRKKEITRPVYILSLGTGSYPDTPNTTMDAGLISSIGPLIDDMFDADEEDVKETFKALQLSGTVKYIRWQPKLQNASQEELDNIDPANIASLETIAENYYRDHFHDADFAELFTILQQRAKEN